MAEMVPAGSFFWNSEKKQQDLGTGEVSWVVKAASTPTGCGHHPADGEKSWGWPGPSKEIIPLGFQHRKGVLLKCYFQWEPPSRPPRQPAALCPLSLSRLADIPSCHGDKS